LRSQSCNQLRSHLCSPPHICAAERLELAVINQTPTFADLMPEVGEEDRPSRSTEWPAILLLYVAFLPVCRKQKKKTGWKKIAPSGRDMYNGRITD
jgi:hypothetical protein